eukprot:Skav227868  [mRNA]  locus=scaffold383:339556:344490:+ [translate_table: standard]
MGVALINRSSLCARPCRDVLPGHWDETCRVMVSIVHMAFGPVKVVTLYGVQHNATDALKKNVTLWHAILALVSQHDMPTLIGGDVNLSVQDLDVWQHFSNRGYSETFEVFRNQFGKELPVTCNGATRHDTLIFSRHFATLFCDATVIQEGLFPCHDPLVVHFAMRKDAYSQRVLPSPEPLNSDTLQSEIFCHAQHRFVEKSAFSFSCSAGDEPSVIHDDVTSSLRFVGDTFERAYDFAVNRFNQYDMGSQPWPVRRNRRTKRCHVDRLLHKPLQQTVKAARKGDYEPPNETFWVRNVQCVKQLRRVQALRNRMKKYLNAESTPQIHWQNMREWLMIQGVQSFQPTFAAWCMRYHLCRCWYHELPPFEWIDELCGALKILVDHRVRDEARSRSRWFRHAIDLDMLHFGGSLSHAIVRGNSVPAPSVFKLPRKAPVLLMRSPAKSCPKGRVLTEDSVFALQEAKVGGTPITLKPVSDANKTCEFVDLPASDDPVHAFGPASILCCYLKIVGWEIMADGSFMDHLERPFSLAELPGAHLNNFLWDAWDSFLTRKIHDRKGLQLWPEIDSLQTRRIDLPLEPRDKAIAANLRCLGTMWGDQREKWYDVAEDQEICCPLCGGPDTREHFPFECPGTEKLRAEYSETISVAIAEFPHMCFVPVIHKHPKFKLLQMAHFERQLPGPFKPVAVTDSPDYVPSFFTDGSCIFPEQGGRLSAWAIVQDCSLNNQERLCHVDAYRATGVLPSVFSTSQVGLTTGPQTINRAEFTAILQIVSSTGSAIIHSDSQWAIDMFHKVRMNPDFDAHVGSPNDDLVAKLCSAALVKDLGNFTLHKLAAHRTDAQAVSDLDLFCILGNRYVDEIAKKGTKRDISPIHEAAWSLGEWYHKQVLTLQHLQCFLSKAEAMRLDGFDSIYQAASDGGGKLFSLARARTWKPEGFSLAAPFVIPEQVLTSFLPGASILQLAVDYLLALVWPPEGSNHVTCSWYELTVNFIGSTHLKPPRIGNRGDMFPDFVDPAYNDTAELLPIKVWDVVRLLETAAAHIHQLMGIQLVPFEDAKIRWHLGYLGYGNKVAGFTRRPLLLHLDQHCDMMRELVSKDGLGLPRPFSAGVSFQRRLLPLDEIPFKEKCSNLRRVRYRVKTHGQF